MRGVLVDHHDSFAWNLAHLFGAATGTLPEVVQSDALDVAALVAGRPDLVLLGPGPGFHVVRFGHDGAGRLIGGHRSGAP